MCLLFLSFFPFIYLSLRVNLLQRVIVKYWNFSCSINFKNSLWLPAIIHKITLPDKLLIEYQTANTEKKMSEGHQIVMLELVYKLETIRWNLLYSGILITGELKGFKPEFSSCLQYTSITFMHQVKPTSLLLTGTCILKNYYTI